MGRDLLFVALAACHSAAVLAVPAAPIIAVGVWWNSNTVAHNFIHHPFFRSRSLNLVFSACQSVLIGIPQALWRDRHLAHHAGVKWRLRWSLQLVVEIGLVCGLWGLLATGNPLFFVTVYLPGYVAGVALCAVQGYYEHAGTTTSHYGRIYNVLCFNDGYHVEHHASPGVHWTALPHRMACGARASRWPPLLRWLDALRIRPGISVPFLGVEAPAWQGATSAAYRAYVSEEQRRQAGCIGGENGTLIPGRVLSLESLERLALVWPALQRFLLDAHRSAFRALLADLPPLRRVAVVGGGLFPRTAIVLRELIPAAEIVVIDASRPNVETARRIVGADVTFEHARFSATDPSRDFDLIVIPLSFQGDREAIYRRPPAGAVLVHDWLWRRRGRGCRVSVALLKRLNLVRQ